MDLRIAKIVIAGGPGGGKSEALPVVKTMIEKAGLKVWIIPEMATMWQAIGAEVKASQDNPTKLHALQKAILRAQLALEDITDGLAPMYSDKDYVIICDRGAAELKAYAGEDIANRVLYENNITHEILLGRYDAVYHLVTAADGAEEHYTTNKVRHESPELARIIDQELQKAWSDHPHHVIIHNYKNGDRNHKINFSEKLEILKRHIAADFGIPYS